MSKLADDAREILAKPLEQWTPGSLKFETASLLNVPEYIVLHDHEKRAKGYPVTNEEMIAFIRERHS